MKLGLTKSFALLAALGLIFGAAGTASASGFMGAGTRENAPDAPLAVSAPDVYGYRYKTGLDAPVFDWFEIVTGTLDAPGVQVFPNPATPGVGVDDAVYDFNPGTPNVIDPVPMGFSFPFYENTYTHIYINSNGLLGFDPSLAKNSASNINLGIPLDYEIPQAIVAPFWDDLRVGGSFNSGKVAYASVSGPGGDYFVVEWHGVTRIDASSTVTVTFEALLYPSGDILFQYKELNGALDSATVGIEDSDGVDGLQYLYNQAGLTEDSAVLFERPDSPDWRVKAFPKYQGVFYQGQANFKVRIRNTGNQTPGDDRYNLALESSNPHWSAKLYNAAGTVELSDTDSDGYKDTGLIAPGTTFTVTVKLSVLPAAQVGSQATFTMTVTSDQYPVKYQQVNLASTIPAPFALTYSNGLPLYAELNSVYGRIPVQEDPVPGAAFALNHASSGNFVGVWENNIGNYYTNIRYVLMDSWGQLLSPFQQLTNNSTPGWDMRDSKPVVATAPDGNIGVAWIRNITDLTDPLFRAMRNVYFAILNADGSGTVLPVSDITGKLWYNPGTIGSITYDSLRIEATQDGYFHLAWNERINLGTVSSEDIGHAVYRASDGFQIVGPTRFTTLNVAIDYRQPALTYYETSGSADRMILSYFVRDSGAPEPQLVYAVLNTATGATIQAQTLLYDMDGEGADGVQLTDGRIALVWTNLTTRQINYAILEQNLTKPGSPSILANPDGRAGGLASVAQGPEGSALITWLDANWSQRLYYALVTYSQVLVKPMSFLVAAPGGEITLRTSAGYGNAANYTPQLHEVFFPLVPVNSP